MSPHDLIRTHNCTHSSNISPIRMKTQNLAVQGAFMLHSSILTAWMRWIKWFCQFVPRWHNTTWQLGRNVTQTAHLRRRAGMPCIYFLSVGPAWKQREKPSSNSSYLVLLSKECFTPLMLPPLCSFYNAVLFMASCKKRQESKPLRKKKMAVAEGEQRISTHMYF